MSVIGDKLRSIGYASKPAIAQTVANPGLARQLSELVQVELPNDYKIFLAEFPLTGMFAEGVVCAGLVPAYFARSGLYTADFLFASSTGKTDDILAVRRTQIQDDMIPRHLLLIGQNFFGDFYCMDLRPEFFGKIYFWCHEDPVEDLYPMGGDFKSFVGNLRLRDPDPERSHARRNRDCLDENNKVDG